MHTLKCQLLLFSLLSIISSIILALVVFGTVLDMALVVIKSLGIYNSNYSSELSSHTTDAVNENDSVRGSNDATMFRTVTNAKGKIC